MFLLKIKFPQILNHHHRIIICTLTNRKTHFYVVIDVQMMFWQFLFSSLNLLSAFTFVNDNLNVDLIFFFNIFSLFFCFGLFLCFFFSLFFLHLQFGFVVIIFVFSIALPNSHKKKYYLFVLFWLQFIFRSSFSIYVFNYHTEFIIQY